MSDERIHKARGLERDYVILRNKDVQRKDLSYEAIGMLVCLMSRPDDWSVYVNELKRDGAGRDKVRNILKELQTKGYVHIEQSQKADGTFSTNEYHVYAMPEYNPHFQPLTENPSTDNPSTDNLPLQSKEGNKEKKREKKKDSAATPQSVVTDTLDPQAATDEVAPTILDLAHEIESSLGLHNGRQWNIAHMLQGSAKKKGYAEYAVHFVDMPVGVDEFRLAVEYFKRECPDCALSSPETIADWIGKYRASLVAKPTITYEMVEPVTEIDPLTDGVVKFTNWKRAE